MGGFTGGEGLLPDVPDIPVPNFTDQAQQWTAGMKRSGWWGQLVAYLATVVQPLIFNFLGDMVSWFDDLAAILIGIMTHAQGMNTPQFYTFVAAMLEDLLGVEVDAQKLQMAWALHGDVSGMQATGGALFDLLTREFNQGMEVTPEGGIAAAKTFIGYLLSFSVREANVATMVSMLPESLRMMDGLRHYASDMARNLGLGRLSRRALQPMIQALIADPMTWYFNKLYRPKLLSESLAVKAWVRGEISEADLDEILARTGYNDAGIAAVKADTWLQPGVSDYYILYKYGGFDDATVLQALAQRGTSPALASLQLAAQQYQDAETEISKHLTTLEQQFTYGNIDRNTQQVELNSLPLSPQQRWWYQHRVAWQTEYPSNHLTLSEYQAAYVAAVIDLSDLVAGLKLLGYSDSDQDVLVNLTLLKLAKTEYTYQKALWTWMKQVEAAQKKGQTPPPKPVAPTA
jgi:hypothetical protein